MMSELNVVAERTIDAPAAKIYEVVANYNEHHPRILLPSFSDWKVEQGGIGAGTVVSFTVKTPGSSRRFRVQVAEPEPGRLLTEADTLSTMVTTFQVDPNAGGSRVHIESSWQSAGGFGGLMERLFAPRVMRKMYADELDRLECYVQKGSAE